MNQIVRRNWSTGRFRFFVYLIAILFCDFMLFGGELIPPFSATGTVLTRAFSTGRTNAIFELQAHFTFSYSNGWWRVCSHYERGNIPGVDWEKQHLEKTILDCSRIADGVRVLYLSQSAGNESNDQEKPLPPAIAWPIAFPPPEEAILFAPWISLCPKPELPVLDNGVIRRFTQASLVNDPRNRGDYSVDYLSPNYSNSFLASVEITNTKHIFLQDGTVKSLWPPFDKGYREFSYLVNAVTNFNGIDFPLRSTCKRFFPKPHAKNENDLQVMSVTSVDIDSIKGETIVPFSIPSKLMAFDRRSSNSPVNAEAKYVVEKDQWKSVTNPRLVHLAQYFGEHAARTQTVETRNINIRRRMILGFLIVLPASFAFIFAYLSAKKHNREK